MKNHQNNCGIKTFLTVNTSHSIISVTLKKYIISLMASDFRSETKVIAGLIPYCSQSGLKRYREVRIDLSFPLLYCDSYLTVIWLPHSQLWAIVKEAASLTRC